MRVSFLLIGIVAAFITMNALAEEAPTSEMELLEFLGTFEEEDKDIDLLQFEELKEAKKTLIKPKQEAVGKKEMKERGYDE